MEGGCGEGEEMVWWWRTGGRRVCADELEGEA